MIVQTYKSRTDTTGKRLDCTWPEFVKRLSKCKQTSETMDDYANMSKSAQGKVKDVGGFVGGEMDGTRSAANIRGRWLVTLDIDHGAGALSWEEFHMLNSSADGEVYNAALYPTHSYTPDDPHLRWVFPLTRSVTTVEYQLLCAELSKWVGAADDSEGMDASTDQPERLMYWPSSPCDFDYESVFRSETDGTDLDPDIILNSIEPPKSSSSTPLKPSRSCGGLRSNKTKALATRSSASASTSSTADDDGMIPCGKRDQTLTSIAGRMRHAGLGPSEIYAALVDVNDRRCEEPMEDADLRRIAKSVSRYAKGDVALVPIVHRGEDLIDMGTYIDCDVAELETAAGSVGLGDSLVANLLMTNIGEQVLYTPSRGFMLWDGKRYVNDDAKVECILMDWVPRARQRIGQTIHDVEVQKARAENFGDEEKAEKLGGDLEFLEGLKKFFGLYLNRGKRDSAMKDWAARCTVPDEMFDADAFALNTPDGLVDLRNGSVRSVGLHDRVTQMTQCSLSDFTTDGEQLWLSFLDSVSGGDQEWIDYMQCALGLACIGKVVREGFFACIGEGGNGKSTMINAISRVLGTYAGTVDNRILTSNKFGQNLGPVKATLRGKRLVVAGELEENSILSASQVKSITSSDLITAEEKYKAPGAFNPSHTLVLYSNFLPRVTSSDEGTWRRIWVLPFDVKQYGTKHEIKRYDDILVEKAGGAILQWLVEGAQKIISTGYKLPKCDKVDNAKQAYKADENPLPRFLDDCCVVEEDAEANATELLVEFNQWAKMTHEHEFTATRFGREMTRLGYVKKHSKHGNVWVGLRKRNMTDDL